MKRIYALTAMICLLLCATELTAQIVWDGPTITFTRAANADWTMPANQDIMTSNVAITRANNLGLFNIAIEASDADGDACTGPEPSGTEWAVGTTADFGTLTYMPLGDLIGCNFSEIVNGVDLVVHLIADDVYIDIKFTSWSNGGGGQGSDGGFAYERSTGVEVGIDGQDQQADLTVFPNPSQDVIQISGVVGNQNYAIYSNVGALVANGNVTNNEQIDVQELSAGLYFFQFENGESLKFMKK